MYYISIFFIVFGSYMIALERFKLPKMQTSKEIIDFYNQGKTQNKIEIFLDDVASKLSRFIIMDEYKKGKITTKLNIAGIFKTPEKFVAESYVKTLVPIVLSIPLSFIFPVIFPVVLIFSVSIYFKEINSLDSYLIEIREKIEYEIPKFTRDIAEYLKSDRNVLLMLERYKNTAGEDLKRELEITIRDMKTGNYETALTRFEARIQSPMLSDVIRGLIAVLRGDNSQFYFQILAHDFKILELERLKAEAIRRPSKIKKYSFILLGCMLLMYTVIITISVIQNMGGIF